MADVQPVVVPFGVPSRTMAMQVTDETAVAVFEWAVPWQDDYFPGMGRAYVDRNDRGLLVVLSRTRVAYSGDWVVIDQLTGETHIVASGSPQAKALGLERGGDGS